MCPDCKQAILSVATEIYYHCLACGGRFDPTHKEQYICALCNRERRRSSRHRAHLPQLYEAQNGVCAGCQSWVPYVRATVDHVHPVSRWIPGQYPYGLDDIPNLQMMCNPCNTAKSTKLGYEKSTAKPAGEVPMALGGIGRFRL